MTVICFVSDSHGDVAITRRAVRQITLLHPVRVFHCGDIGSPEVIECFAQLPTRFVFGNCDFEREELSQTSESVFSSPIEDIQQETIQNKTFFVYHGTHWNTLERAVGFQEFDYVAHGHTHEKRDERVGRTRIINPGALTRAREFTFASLELDNDLLTFHSVR